MRRSRRVLAATLTLSFFGAAGLFLGARPGTAAPILALRPGPIDRPVHMVVADFDRDGTDDLLVANFQAGTLTLLLNQGDGTFALHPDSPIPVGTASFSFPTAGPLHMAVDDLNPEDVDSDGVLNAVDNCPNVYNPARCRVTDPACAVEILCVDGSHPAPDCDLANPSDLDPVTRQCDSDANGVGDHCQLLDPGCLPLDTDGDGIFDYDPAAVTDALDNCPRRPNPMQEDLNSDRVGDLCAASPDVAIAETNLGGGSPLGIVRVKVNTGAGGLVSRGSKITDIGPAEVLLGRFGGDARLDLAVSNTGSDDLLLFLGLADGEFQEIPQIITTGDGPQGLAALDFDGDGSLDDLAVANRGASTVGLYVNSGTGLPTTMTSSQATLPRPTALLSGRLDGDACPDLVVLDQELLACVGGPSDGSTCSSDADCSGGTCTCRRGSIEIFTDTPCPGSVLAPASTIALADGVCPRGGTLADLDLDGNLDLAVADFTGGRVLVYLGAGDGTFSPAGSLSDLPAPAAVAALDLDSQDATGPDPDLAVLEFEGNKVDLILFGGPMMLSLSPTTPASPWKNTSGLALYAADFAVGNDIALLQGSYDSVTMQCTPSPPRLDILTGIGNGFFLPLDPMNLKGPVCASSMLAADLRLDFPLDLLVVDEVGSTVSVVVAEPSGDFTEKDPIQVGAGPIGASVGSLIADPLDYDRDGVADLVDDCPTRYNPPLCKVTDPECAVEILCEDATHPKPDCLVLDPMTMQCDSDGNGVGDHCQLLNESCLPIDTDSDLIFDYNPANQVLDNCPWIVNNSQVDADDDGIGDACAVQVNDIVTVSPSGGALTVLIGDGSGSFREAAFSPISGFTTPVAAAVGGFSLTCTSFFGAPTCNDKTTNDIAVVEQVVQGNTTDDRVTVLRGDGTGSFSTAVCEGGTNNGDLCTMPADCPLGTCRTFGPVGAQGDPTTLLSATDQPVCANPATPSSDPGMRFDSDSLVTTLAIVEPNPPALRILLPSSDGLVPPPGNPLPLPLLSPPSDASFVDLNQDDVMDLVALSKGDLDPSTPNVTIYLGIANGLFYTDPSFNPAGVCRGGSNDGDPCVSDAGCPGGACKGIVKDGSTRIATGNVNLAVDSTYPDVVLFDEGDAAPIVLTNILKERADIDGSGRVDGFDLAILARAFGATRGEDFTILGNGTLEQSGSGFSKVVVGSGVLEVGKDIPDFALNCDRRLDALAGAYGLPVDLNLDGLVDGDDLALLASLFGRSF
jgi:VCBS repeat protein/thrombospondin type 3 repeat protein